MMEQPICICGKRAQVYKNKQDLYYVQCNTCNREIIPRNTLSQTLYDWYNYIAALYSEIDIREIDDRCIEVVKDS